MHRFGRVFSLLAGLFALAVAPAVYADSVSFTFNGSFTYDNDVQLFHVTLGSPESLLAYTTSGATGGFPTFLMLFDSDGSPVQQQSGDPACLDGYSSYGPNGCNDAYLLEPPALTPPEYLPPGKFTIALVQWDNYWNGSLSDGFMYDGAANRNFTNAYGYCGTGTAYFCDPSSNTQDSPDWSLTITLTSAAGTPALGDASVPEPASAMMCLGGLATVFLARRRSRRAPPLI